MTLHYVVNKRKRLEKILRGIKIGLERFLKDKNSRGLMLSTKQDFIDNKQTVDLPNIYRAAQTLIAPKHGLINNYRDIN